MAPPSTHSSPGRRLIDALASALDRLSPRERNAVIAAAWVLGLGLLWWLALAPAIRTLGQAPAQHAAADAELSRLRAMASTAEAVRAQTTAPAPGRADALRALEESMASLGATAQLSTAGDTPTVTLRNTPPEALALWLARVRINARLTPVEAQLNGTTEPAGWSGSLVLGGPPLSGGN